MLFETPNVFHCPSYMVVPGLGVVSSNPMFTVSSLNWTPAIPLVVWPVMVGSEAEAEREMVLETVVLFVGEVREMVGGVRSGVGVTTQLWVVMGVPPVQLLGELTRTVLVWVPLVQLPHTE